MKETPVIHGSRNPGRAAAALRFVRRIVRGSESGRRLPTTRTLAARLGCAEITVRRALAQLKTERRICTVMGGGTYVGSAPPAGNHTPLRVRPRSPEQVADQLRKLIGTGVLRTGDKLPLLKTLALQFHISMRSVSQAYTILAAQGYATKIGRTCWVGRFGDLTGESGRGRIILFNCARGAGFEDLYGPHHPRALAYRSLETELLRHGYSFRYEPYNRLDHYCEAWKKGGLLPASVILAEPEIDRYEEILSRVQPFFHGSGRPETKILALSLASAKPPSNVILSCIGNIDTVHMRCLAEALARRSLHTIAVFYDENHPDAPPFAAMAKLRTELVHLDASARFRFAVVPRMHKNGGRFIDRIIAQYGQSRLESTYSKYTPTPFAKIAAETTEFRTLAAAICSPQTRFADAWVFAQDGDAQKALLGLRREGVAVPRNRSVVSVENNPAFFSAGISACAPDYIHLGYQMAHALLGDIPTERTTHGYVRPHAVFLERTTTRPPIKSTVP